MPTNRSSKGEQERLVSTLLQNKQSESAESKAQRQIQAKRTKCLSQAQGYQHLFSSVQPLASTQLLPLLSAHREQVLLVDVRTEPERNVSIIPGAKSLEDAKAILNAQDTFRHSESAFADTTTATKNENENCAYRHIVCYCSIGYRSGREATRLAEEHPQWADLFYNLDGILAYTHAVQEEQQEQSIGSTNSSSLASNHSHRNDAPRMPRTGLLHPETQQETARIHVFGAMWDLVDSNVYESVYFARQSLLVRLAQVSWQTTQQAVQRVARVLTCRRQRRRRRRSIHRQQSLDFTHAHME